MKKTLSVFLILLLTLVPISSFAAENSTLIYGMSLENASDGALTDSGLTDLANNFQTGKGNEIVIKGSPAVKSEKINGSDTVKMLNFYGTGSTVTNFSLEPSDTVTFRNLASSTVSVWVRPQNAQSENVRTIFSFSNANLSDSVYYAGFKTAEDGKLMLTVYSNGETAEADVSEYENKFINLVFTRSFTENEETEKTYLTFKAYLNTKEIISVTDKEVTREDENNGKKAKYLYIGAPGSKNENVSGVLNGDLAEFKLYSTGLSENERKLAYISSQELFTQKESSVTPGEGEGGETTAEEKILFDLVVGDTVSDLTDSADSTTVFKNRNNVTKDAFSGMTGAVNYLHFSDDTKRADGYAPYLEFSGNNIWNKDEFTIETWLRMTDGPSSSYWGNIFVNSPGNLNNHIMRITYLGDSYALDSASSQYNYRLKIGGGAYFGKWAHLAVTAKYDDENGKLATEVFINGESVMNSEIEYESRISENNSYWCLGGITNSASESFRGDIATFTVYDKVRSTEKITADYKKDIDKYTEATFESEKSEIAKDASQILMTTASDKSTDYILKSGITFSELESGKAVLGSAQKTNGGFLVTFGQYFKYGDIIKVYSNEAKSYTGINIEKGFTDIDFTLYNESLSPVSKPDGSKEYMVKPVIKNNSENTAEYKYIIVFRDEKGASVASFAGEASIDGGKTSGNNFIKSFSGTSDAVKAELYVYEKTLTGLKPVYGSPSVKK